ncbi:hypothetical protein [Bradyrhizobium lablabi]|uniref:hypothetical protein n=1 Tax=Bradyrhizobium lablabi TaxID=722472 RepID=UPI001BAB529A|nr:hypothetical protein [Bradyrhizobium lablabi]MBR0696744.1 hypothetical protein [Bradyrhizobium lablabi]
MASIISSIASPANSRARCFVSRRCFGSAFGLYGQSELDESADGFAAARLVILYRYTPGMPCTEIFVAIPGTFSNANEVASELGRMIAPHTRFAGKGGGQ